MCGIAALVTPGRKHVPAVLDAIEADLFHRGPDAGGQYVRDSVALVHRRLSILDPSEAANQPMVDDSGRFAITYNGEIYNYRELRTALSQAGVALATDGDTEAVLLGYRLWGEAVFDRLEGMFALAIHDRDRNLLVAARDPFGIKPLYLHRGAGVMMLSSEVRPMRHITDLEPDPAALGELINYRWAAGRLSNFKAIDRVPGGTIVTVSLDDASFSERRFCDPLDSLADDRAIDARTAEEMAELALADSVKAHLASDVGYTIQLSGGVDSSLVAALARQRAERPIKTFALYMPGYAHDERRWREMLLARYAFDHHEVEVTGRDFAEALPRALSHIEGPSPHLGCVLLMLLCDRIAQSDKVVLTGEGGDEFFGGYSRYADWRKTRWQEWVSKLVPGRMLPGRWPFVGIKQLAGRDAAAMGGVYHDFLASRRLFPGLAAGSAHREQVSGRFGPLVDRLFAVDQTAYLESLLVRQDKVAMAASVEARVPFVHWPLAQRLNRIPRSIMAPGDGATKPLLKRIAERHVPREMLYRRKVGLLLPYGDWLRDADALGGYLDQLVAPDSRLMAFADRPAVEQVVARFRAGEAAEEKTVMQLVNVETWLRNIPNATRLLDRAA